MSIGAGELDVLTHLLTKVFHRLFYTGALESVIYRSRTGIPRPATCGGDGHTTEYQHDELFLLHSQITNVQTHIRHMGLKLSDVSDSVQAL